jgi:hypothetical protein
MHRTRASLVGLTAFALIAPASASAATLTTDRPCYIQSQPMTITGAGWVPGSSWSVETDQLFDFGDADPAGNFVSTNETAPIVVGDTFKPKTFTLTGKQDNIDVATATFKVVDFIAQPKDGNGKPTGKTKWRFAGFNPGKTIYIHTRRGSKTYLTKVGKGDATCGTASKRLKRLPGVPASQIKNGEYKVFVDNRRKFAKSNGNFLQYSGEITIYNTYN